jgi:uncharacterized protein YbaR (Trm112 family)
LLPINRTRYPRPLNSFEAATLSGRADFRFNFGHSSAAEDRHGTVRKHYSRLLSLLECPRDHSELLLESSHLCCARGHRYPIVSGVPVFLLPEKEQTIGIAAASLKAAESGIGGPLYLDTLGLSDAEKRGIERDWIAGSKIDPAKEGIRGQLGAVVAHSHLRLALIAEQPIKLARNPDA